MLLHLSILISDKCLGKEIEKSTKLDFAFRGLPLSSDVAGKKQLKNALPAGPKFNFVTPWSLMSVIITL